MSSSPILVSIDANENDRNRTKRLQAVIEKDKRFRLIEVLESIPFDLRFHIFGLSQFNVCMHIELKDFTGDNNSDYLQSILSGRLYKQCLAARELGEPFAIVVLGGDEDVAKAIVKASMSRGLRGTESVDKILEYERMVEGFEANALALGIQIWRLKDNPYKRMLLRVRKILEGGDLTGFRPKPADGERKAVGLAMILGHGIGPSKANSILEFFDFCLIGRDKPGLGIISPRKYNLVDCLGIGPKLAPYIRKNIVVVEGEE